MSQQSRVIRAAVDTSVFGGAFDDEFREHSRAFFERVLRREIIVILSDVTEAELSLAPTHVQQLARSIPTAALERVALGPDSETLCEAYLSAGVVSRKWRNDAMLVAIATTARADVLVSWNFKHIVRFDRMRAFNAVNTLKNYAQLSITSPAEVRYAGQDETL